MKTLELFYTIFLTHPPHARAHLLEAWTAHTPTNVVLALDHLVIEALKLCHEPAILKATRWPWVDQKSTIPALKCVERSKAHYKSDTKTCDPACLLTVPPSLSALILFLADCYKQLWLTLATTASCWRTSNGSNNDDFPNLKAWLGHNAVATSFVLRFLREKFWALVLCKVREIRKLYPMWV